MSKQSEAIDHVLEQSDVIQRLTRRVEVLERHLGIVYPQVCPQCEGVEDTPAARYCTRCGAALPHPPTTLAGQIRAALDARFDQSGKTPLISSDPGSSSPRATEISESSA